MLKIRGIIHVSTVQDCSVGSLDFNKTVTAVTQHLTPNINSDWHGFERLSAERTGEQPWADLGQPLVASQQGKNPNAGPGHAGEDVWMHSAACGGFAAPVTFAASFAPHHHNPAAETCCTSNMKGALPITKLMSVPTRAPSHTWALLTPKCCKHVLKWFSQGGVYLPRVSLI